MFSNKPPIEAGNARATINKGASVDGFQSVRWFNKLDWDLHGQSSFYMNHGILCTRENLR